MGTGILFIDHTAQLGGAELSLLDLAKHVSKDSAVVLFDHGPLVKRLEEVRVPVHVIGNAAAFGQVRRHGSRLRKMLGLAAALPLAAKLHRLIAQQRPQVLYANTPKAMIVAVLAGFSSRTPVVWHLRDILCPRNYDKPTLQGIIALANRGVRKVIANSDATAEAFFRAGGDPARTCRIYNGIDPGPFLATSGDGGPFPETESKEAGGALVGVFSRLAPWKGQHVVLEALTHLPEFRLLLVGEALFGENDYAASLRHSVAGKGLEGRVDFLGFRSDVPELMRRVDIVVHPSVEPEPFGRSIVEGMLAGKPVVASRIGGIPELIQDGVNGLLISPGDAEELAKCLRELSSDPAGALRLARAGRDQALERFALDRMAREIRQTLEGMISS